MADHPFVRSAVVTCILNATAGSDRAGQARDEIAALFARNGAQARIVLAQDGSEIPELARRAVADGSQPVVAGGGDGTLSAVAAALVGTGHALGIVPLGTLNHFATDLKIPMELDGAIANLFTGKLARIDVGEVNGQPFLNNSSLGIYPAMVHEREQLQARGIGKWLAFARASLAILGRYAPMLVQLQVDAQEQPVDATAFVFIGNNRYEMAGTRIGERTRLDGGRLWVCCAPPASRTRLLHLAVQALFGRVPSGEYTIHDAQECRVRTRAKRLRVARDGEVTKLETPLHYRIRPGALGVIVPAAATDGSPV
jgi:diacylglycerol kinase family enzyme